MLVAVLFKGELPRCVTTIASVERGRFEICAEQPNGAVSFSALKAEVLVGSKKAEEAVAFYKAAFGADEVKRSTYPKRKADQELPLLLSAELRIGPSVFVVSDLGDESQGGSGIVLRLETEDVAGAVSKAVKAGAVQDGEIMEEEGGMLAKLKDPFGTVWAVASAPKKTCGDAQA